MQITEPMTTPADVDEPAVTVHGHLYTASEARHLSHVLRIAADRVEFASGDAVDVLRAGAEMAGTNLVELAQEAQVGTNPDLWTKYDARRVAVALGQLSARRA